MICDCIDCIVRFRILNSVYRGQVICNGAVHLQRALKIIMHSNYVHTREHTQRMHEHEELSLDAVPEDVEVPPIDDAQGFDDINVGDRVEVWHARTWWHGKITYKSRVKQTINVRFTGSRDSVTGILPRNIKPADDIAY